LAVVAEVLADVEAAPAPAAAAPGALLSFLFSSAIRVKNKNEERFVCELLRLTVINIY